MGRSNYRSGHGGRGRGNQGRNSYKSGSNGSGKANSYKSNGSQSYNYTRSNPKQEFDLHYPCKPQTVPYDTVLEAILLKIQTEFEGGYDVAKSLKNVAMVDLAKERPTRLVSTLADPVNRSIEQDGLNIDYQEAIKVHHT